MSDGLSRPPLTARLSAGLSAGLRQIRPARIGAWLGERLGLRGAGRPGQPDRQVLRWPPADKAQPAPAPGDLLAMPRHRYAGPCGARDYLMFTPPVPARRPAVVVMLHGCQQDAADFARGTGMNVAAARRGYHVIYPEQTRRANSLRCWNWFRPRHQQAGSGEAGLLAGLIDEAMQRAGIAGADVFVAGMSAGGTMAATLAAAYPRMIRAAGVHSGLPARAARSFAAALDAMRQGVPPGPDWGVPLIVFHGDEDDVVVAANGRSLAAHLGRGATYRGGAAAEGRHPWRCRKGPRGEYWRIAGLGHAWSGGGANGGSFTDPAGPDASAEMLRFFDEMRRAPR